jgi:AraC-like DNA-binding protein
MHATPVARPRTPLPSTLAAVSTVLTPAERLRVDAAGEGLYRTIHRESAQDVAQDVRESRANAVVVSVKVCERGLAEPFSEMVREFPRVPTMALLSEVSPRTPQTLLMLGTSGVRRLIDVRDANGWSQLRSAVCDECGNTVQRYALGKLAEDLTGVSDDCWRFFQGLFLCTPDVCTIRRLADHLNVQSSTLMSRFFRARLPSPKHYLAMARLVRAAHLFENRGFSVANVANHLQYSSPQSFGRHVRALMHITAQEFRERVDSATMVDRFRQEIVHPYIATLRRIRPLVRPSGPQRQVM